jgi:DNA polymerase-4
MDYGHRKIIHIDMDCFYAAVEMRDRPDLKNRPLAVGGSPTGRGVLTTCNYPARRYGLRSALSAREAVKLCPDLVILPTRMNKYREISLEILEIMKSYTPKIERVSLDEAYLDVTDSTLFEGSASLIAKQLRTDIREKLDLTASAGIAPNKFLAKVASDWKKPDGQYTLAPADIPDFIKTLPVQKVPGVGRSFLAKLSEKNLKTCGDLQAISLSDMTHYWGQWGARLFDLCRGVDLSPVRSERKRKSISVERTFKKDISTWEDLRPWVENLFEELEYRVNKNNIQTERLKSLGVKMKTQDFEITSLEKTLPFELDSYLDLSQKHFYNQNKALRLLGLGAKLNEKTEKKNRQQMKFELSPGV